MRIRDAEAARKIREAKAQIELADIEAATQRELAEGSPASSRRSACTTRDRGRSSIVPSRQVCAGGSVRPFTNPMPGPTFVGPTPSRLSHAPEYAV